MSLQQSSPVPALTHDGDGYSLSAYRGQITAMAVTENLARVKVAFPALAPEFFQVLIERMKEKGFSDKRMYDAVNHVIDHCQYPTPTLANFLSFDKRVKILDYHQLCSQVLRQEASWDDFDKIKINGKIYWVRKSEKELYNIPEEI